MNYPAHQIMVCTGLTRQVFILAALSGLAFTLAKLKSLADISDACRIGTPLS